MNAPKDLKPMGIKAPISLLPRDPLGAIAGVLEHGAVKYGPWNWQDTTQAQARIEELHNALLRHTLASSDPSQDDYDDESGIHHLAHAGACILILLFKLGVTYQPSNWVIDGQDPLPANTKIERDPVLRKAGRKFWATLLGREIPESFVMYRCMVNGNLWIVDPLNPDLTHYVMESRLQEEGLLPKTWIIRHTFAQPGLPTMVRELDTTIPYIHDPRTVDIGVAWEDVRKGMASPDGKGLDHEKWQYRVFGPDESMPFIGNMVHVSDVNIHHKIIDYFLGLGMDIGVPDNSNFVMQDGIYRAINGRTMWYVKAEELGL